VPAAENDGFAATEDGTMGVEAVALLTAKENVTPDVAGVEGEAKDVCGVESCKGVEDVRRVVTPRANVVPILSSETVEETIGVALALDIKGKVSPPLPELVAVLVGAGGASVDGTEEVVVAGGWLDVLLAVAGVGVLLGFAAGTDGKVVNGGEAPGSFGTAATNPTIPEGLTGMSGADVADEAVCADEAAGLGEVVAAGRAEIVLSTELVLATAEDDVGADSDIDSLCEVPCALEGERVVSEDAVCSNDAATVAFG
jgi:hypothetical protein